MRPLPPVATSLLCLALACAGARPPAAGDVTPERAVVDRLVAAFNAHDPDAMRALVADDVVWLSVEGDAVREEARGGDALRDGMRGYFRGVPDVVSTSEAVLQVGPHVSVRERVRWTGRGGPRTQAALAVYEVREGKVRRVWYYPAAP